MRKKREAEFQRLWDEARRAALAAASEQNAKLGDQNVESGSAWLSIPRTLPFGRWAEREGINNDDGEGDDVQIWDAWIHDVYTQAMSVHKAAAQPARAVLCRGLQTLAICVVSQPD
jgi:hypothetical protein